MKKRILSLLLTLTMLLGMTVAIPSTVWAIESDTVVNGYKVTEYTGDTASSPITGSLSAGQVTAGKEVTKLADGKFSVTLSALGKNFEESTSTTSGYPVDVVFVLDVSASMDDSRLEDMRDAVDSAITSLLAADNGKSYTNEYAVVKFGESAAQVIGFKSTYDSTDKSKITGITNTSNSTNVGMYTNIQGGLNYAYSLLNGKTGATPVIILLSDGQPNRYYDASKSYGASPKLYPYGSADRQGSGADATSNSVINTVKQATSIKASLGSTGKIFTIGFALDSISNSTQRNFAYATLNPTAANLSAAGLTSLSEAANKYNNDYYSGSIGDLGAIFTEIIDNVTTLSPLADSSSLVVTDVIGSGFEPDGDIPAATVGTAVYTAASNTVTWTIPASQLPTGTTPATYTFPIKPKADTGVGTYFTNASASASFTARTENPAYPGVKEQTIPLTAKGKLSLTAYPFTVRYYKGSVASANEITPASGTTTSGTTKLGTVFGTLVPPSDITANRPQYYGEGTVVNADSTISQNTPDNVINVVYPAIPATYTIKYYYEGLDGEYAQSAEHPDTTLNGNQGDVITDINSRVTANGEAGFSHSLTTGLPLTLTESDNIIKVYYDRGEYSYTVKYYKDSSTLITSEPAVNASFGQQITADDIDLDKYLDSAVHGTVGYKFSSSTAPITIGTGTNNINVYYVKDSFPYTIEYYFDSISGTPAHTESSATNLELGTAVTLTSAQINAYRTGTYSEGVVSPSSLNIAPSGNVFKVLYLKEQTSYTVKHVELDSTFNVLATEGPFPVNIGEDISATAKSITGWSYDSKDESRPAVKTSSGNVLYVYYTKNIYGYTVEYYKDSESSPFKIDQSSGQFGNTVSLSGSTKNKYLDSETYGTNGYSYGSDTGSITITENAAGNVIKVYYVKQSYPYTIVWYREGSTLPIWMEIMDEVPLGTQITLTQTVKEKHLNDPLLGTVGYELDTTAPEPLTITYDALSNIINVYYAETRVGYTVYHVEKDNTSNILKTQSGTTTPGSWISATDAGIAGWDYDSVSHSLLGNGGKFAESDPSLNVVYVYYTKEVIPPTTEPPTTEPPTTEPPTTEPPTTEPPQTTTQPPIQTTTVDTNTYYSLTVRYQDTAGNSIPDIYTLQSYGHLHGSDYSVTIPLISGYTYVSSSGDPLSGKMLKNMDITLYYQKIVPTTEATTAQPTTAQPTTAPTTDATTQAPSETQPSTPEPAEPTTAMTSEPAQETTQPSIEPSEDDETENITEPSIPLAGDTQENSGATKNDDDLPVTGGLQAVMLAIIGVMIIAAGVVLKRGKKTR